MFDLESEFYVVSLPCPQAYLVSVGRIRELFLNQGFRKGWFKTHSCIALNSHPQLRDRFWIDPDHSDFIEKMSSSRYDRSLFFFEGIIGMAYVLKYERLGVGTYKFTLGDTWILPVSYPYKQGKQIDVIDSKIKSDFLKVEGIERW